jgi:hypothetical protein
MSQSVRTISQIFGACSLSEQQAVIREMSVVDPRMVQNQTTTDRIDGGASSVEVDVQSGGDGNGDSGDSGDGSDEGDGGDDDDDDSPAPFMLSVYLVGRPCESDRFSMKRELRKALLSELAKIPATILHGVLTAILIAVILAWLGMSK